MRLAVSNIAWDVAEDLQIAQLLQRTDIDAIDIAPGKYFPVPVKASVAEIGAVRQWWKTRGIEITGMQALLFGTQGLDVFGHHQIQQQLLDHLRSVCRIAGLLHAPRLVFGSPRNRDRSALDDNQTIETACDFFSRAGDIAAEHGVSLCLEANPVRYGANFMLDSRETAEIVKAVNHPAIRMQFDTGAVFINRENPVEVLDDCHSLIGHCHLSEPDLVPLGDADNDHTASAKALHEQLAEQILCIEMVATETEPHLQSIQRAIEFADYHYRRPAWNKAQ